MLPVISNSLNPAILICNLISLWWNQCPHEVSLSPFPVFPGQFVTLQPGSDSHTSFQDTVGWPCTPCSLYTLGNRALQSVHSWHHNPIVCTLLLTQPYSVYTIAEPCSLYTLGTRTACSMYTLSTTTLQYVQSQYYNPVVSTLLVPQPCCMYTLSTKTL